MSVALASQATCVLSSMQSSVTERHNLHQGRHCMPSLPLMGSYSTKDLWGKHMSICDKKPICLCFYMWGQTALPYLHSLGGLTTAADSAQIEASVGRVAQLQLQGGSLTHDGYLDSVQAIDLDRQHLTVQASLAGAETDADILAGSRSKHAG